jgi:hypothetical protein
MATQYKVVFTGPVGSGKTTAIQTLSDIEVVQTETAASDHIRDLKPSTTVAMDYGHMKLASGDKVHLYGTPGQKRFDFMWDILARDAQGLVLLISARAHKPVDDLRLFCKQFHPFVTRNDLVVGVTHAEQTGGEVATALMDELQQQGAVPRVMEVDARNRKHMAILVESIIYSMKTPHGA